MNMKKLIDETDFDNLNQLSKKWKNPKAKQTIPSLDVQKQNHSDNSIPEPSSSQKKPTKPQNVEVSRKRNVVPQVIDEDTEHFKNRLEHLLNTFKTDAVGQFMSMKQNMLDYQKENVKADTQKYLTMYEEKHQQLLETKQKLLKVSQEAQKKSTQVELLSDHIAKLNQRVKITKYLSRPFSILVQNKETQKVEKFKMRQAQKFDEKRLKRKSIWGWVGVYKNAKEERTHEENQQRIEKQVNEIVGKFQKEMQMLKERLEDATKKNEEYENNKFIMQENLKKAFLRGVCAMNMEAMGVIGTENSQENLEQKSENESVMNNMSLMENTKSNFTQPHNQSMLLSHKQNNTTIQSSNVMMLNQPKAESKDFKWKEAPIMGTEQKIEAQEPRMQIVKPTTEGKVIKVVDGKSSIEPNKSTKGQASDRKSVTTGSRKKI